ncbi:RNA polymerase sigma-70 factor (family 1) [Pedobacter africanus]|uniref:RNA polymerase sigma-70 factor (ECF subfamily) n=1 Tax=Pedobacter africanus TaxID=151894 RepID=A0ACC6KZ47_9SPHI|nr:RNA polymerase sigma-70 factor [Pedobacter africanus]MDR6784496.1 RNA polymerase sigma-70 factor (ECF subfamily) [Pedobacter africanus]
MKQLIHKSDEELLQVLQQGNRQAYEVIYDRYWQILFRFARKMMQDESAAKDVVQDVFTTLWIKSAEKNIRPPLAAFLYTLIRNKILDRIKHSKVEAKYLDSLKQVMSLSEALPDRMYIEKELYDQIEKEISQLPEKMRIIFEKSRKEYKSNQEIAEELSISNKTVRNQLSNAVRILRNKFGDSAHIFLTFF